tara:strand:- start:87 stop:2279 length:2193 start_codon:yes stop_codon:yes gene_type:complete
MKVRIKKLGKKAYGGQNSNLGLDVNPTAFGGADYSMSKGSKGFEIKRTITADPRDQSNLEAEGGETAFGPISGDAIPDHMIIKGPRHSSGGVPLNLPDDTFIFSDTKAMKITDPVILKMFGKKKKKGGYTPAELAKPYDISKYKAILLDPNADELSKNTAEIMIKNMIVKLGALALAQEAKKGFPQGIPEMARPYMEQAGISDQDLLPDMPEQAPQEMMPPQEMPQQMAEQPMMAPPTQMPSGQPIAQPTSMAPQPGMMAFGGPAELDKFIYNDGGLYKAQNGDGGKKKKSERAMTAEELRKQQDKEIRKYKGTEAPEGYIDIGDGIYGRGTIRTGEVEGVKEYERNRAPVGGGSNPNLIADLCRNMQTEGSVHYGKPAAVVLEFANYVPGSALFKQHLETLKACEVKAQDVEGSQQSEFLELTQDQEICECVDPTNNETYTFPLPEGEEECPCVKLIAEGKRDGSLNERKKKKNPAVISDKNANMMMAAARMDPGVASAQLVVPGKTQIKVPYKEIYIQDDLAAAREISEARKPASLADAAAMDSQTQGRLMQQINKESAATRKSNIDNQFRGDIAKARMDQIYENAFANTWSKQNILNKKIEDERTSNRNQYIMGKENAQYSALSDKERLAWMLANPEIASQYTADFRDPSDIEFVGGKKPVPKDEMTMADRAALSAQINKYFPGEANAEARKRELEMSVYGPNASKNTTPVGKFGGYLPIHVGDLFK